MNTICIMCPMGCALTVEKNGDNVVVIGNTCKRGEVYGTQEFTAPKRIVTSLVKLSSGGVVSVKTDRLILKSDISKVLDALKDVEVSAPINIGDVIIYNVAESGANLVATSKIAR